MERLGNKWVVYGMGGLCSRRSTDESALHRSLPHVNGHLGYSSGVVYQSHGLPVQANANAMQSPTIESMDKQLHEPFSFPEVNAISLGTDLDDINDGIPRLSRALSNKSRSTRSKQVAIAKVCFWGQFFVSLGYLSAIVFDVVYCDQLSTTRKLRCTLKLSFVMSGHGDVVGIPSLLREN